MTEEEFPAYLARAIERRAERYVRRGLWREGVALETARRELAEWLPQGLRTPHHYLVHIVDERNGARLGESHYTVEERGGKAQFWVEWIAIEPQHRRKGFATEALDGLAREAALAGADRVYLKVFSDNPGARALYEKVGFVVLSTDMVRPVGPPILP